MWITLIGKPSLNAWHTVFTDKWGVFVNFKRGVKCGDDRDPRQGGSHTTYCPTSLYDAKYGTSNVSDMKSSSHI